VEDDTLSRLLVAAGNPDIARALSEAQVPERLRAEHKARLMARIEGWNVLSDALWNTQADFLVARRFLDDIGTDEPSFGVVLHTLINHHELSSRLAENPVLPDTPLVSEKEQEIGSHDEFIAYLRAWLGVASVLSVYAWADSVPVDSGRERALGILNLWQGFKGYREVSIELCILVHSFHMALIDRQPPDDITTNALSTRLYDRRQGTQSLWPPRRADAPRSFPRA